MSKTLKPVLEQTLRLATRIARVLWGGAKQGVSLIAEKVRERQQAKQSLPTDSSSPPRPSVPEPQSVASTGPGPIDPVDAAGAPLGSAEPVAPATHASEETTLVAEVADPGAEDGAGPEVRVAEPWEGYSKMKATEVVARLADATPEEAAIVQLYERMKRGRKTVLAAAEKRL